MEVAPRGGDTQTLPPLRCTPVAITDLLDRIPFSPQKERAPAPPPPRPFGVELPEVERVGIDLPPGVDLPPSDGAAQDAAPPQDPEPVASEPDQEAVPSTRPPLPSYAVAAIGGLLLLCLALAIALLAVAQGAAPAEAAPSEQAEPAAGPGVPPELDAAFTAEPSPIPVDLLTRLEAASDQPLEVELGHLLDAVQHGFGRRSAHLEPTLRSYVYRMSSRFEWNPDSFRVAVTAPDGGLAAARGATLERLFDDAVASGRLQVGTGVGPHALTLVTP